MSPKVFVHRHNRRLRRREVRAYPPTWTVSRFGRGFSDRERTQFSKLLSEVREGKRAGYSYTGLFKFDVDDNRSMQHTYDKLGHRVMYAIASTNRLADDFDFDRDGSIGHMHGHSLWRDNEGRTYIDDIRLIPDIDDEAALRIAREQGQFIILKVDGRTRSFAFLEAPCFDVTIRGQGADRSFDPRPEMC